ncbi:uncharacterized protein IWZ02DRAFT_498456 [Phyllosticta citriasiana]|uniref:N-acetyltransferase domain-containing protein n=1 Tax=Phyllosticta citriasiana TaxID=595635 RepID=A0ABR1KPC7_9PEZI
MTVTTREIKFFKAEDLKNDTTLQTQVIDLINIAFAKPPKGQPLSTGLRFENPEEFFERLANGICAVLFLEGAPVATAALIPWKSDSMDGDDFELSTVAVPPGCRKLGFAEACCAAAEEAIMSQRSASSEAKEARLWLKCSETRAAPHWIRRGFVETERTLVPAGTWGSEHEFNLITMCRPLRRSSC